jgi:hypothetical protein
MNGAPKVWVGFYVWATRRFGPARVGVLSSEVGSNFVWEEERRFGTLRECSRLRIEIWGTPI